MAIEYPISFIRADGLIVVARTPEDCVDWSVDAKHRERIAYVHEDGPPDRTAFVEHDWIARDALGAVVLTRDLPRTPKRSWRAARNRVSADAAERGLPIPGTGSCCTRHRKPVRALIGEDAARRNLADDLADAGLARHAIRPGRKVRPDPWDDGDRRRSQRCWKKNRRTRWR